MRQRHHRHNQRIKELSNSTYEMNNLQKKLTEIMQLKLKMSVIIVMQIQKEFSMVYWYISYNF